jgi:eukaryotic-like serine/threonine-protein kinase
VTIGAFLGPYEITALLGKGGMGEVYRARDTKLKREVAIKILPAEFSRDAERLLRFQREAEMLAAFNHQSIGAIYDLAEAGGTRFLVLELVEGQTLDELIASRGAMRLDDALRIGAQICEALGAAHEKGIVHRDLKPANVKITPDGKVKVLDFGLAKVFQERREAATTSDLPTLTNASVPGVILGTPAYMAPEQVRGETIDRRADIWAFGVVLWEMVTGKRLYSGKTVSDVLAAVIREEPDWNQAPAKLLPLLKRCLEKEPQRRLRDIGDAMAIVENTTEVQPHSSRVTRVLAAVVVLLLAALSALVFVRFNAATPEVRVLVTSIDAPENASLDFGADFGPPALSPDGRRIVFAVRRDGKTQLWVRSLDSAAAQPLAGAENAQFPFWSPDSQSIGYFADAKLKRIDVPGGSVLTLADAPNPRGGSWSPEGIIVFASNFAGQLQKVKASGGAPEPATSYVKNDYAHMYPWFLPDGRHFFFEAQTQANINEVTLRVGLLDSQEVKTVGPAQSNAVYSSGYLLYLRENILMAQPFDETRLIVSGEPRAVASQVRGAPTPNFIGAFTVSRQGLLAYQSGGSAGLQLTWFGRNGKPIGPLGDPADFYSLALSPDGKSVATARLDENNDIWIYDVTGGLARRLTLNRDTEQDAVWSPDGKSIAYRSNAKGAFDLYRKAADGTRSEELLYADGVAKIASSWSPDGANLLFFRIDPKTQRDIWVLPGARSASTKPFPWLATPANEAYVKFSPDGLYVAYASDESGRYEVYVAPFPGPGGKRQVSNGGTHPHWRGDGKEIFYLGPNGTIMSAPLLIRGAAIAVGETQSLGIRVPAGRPSLYDVSADGQRFLVATPAEQKSASLTLVQNWTGILKK